MHEMIANDALKRNRTGDKETSSLTPTQQSHHTFARIFQETERKIKEEEIAAHILDELNGDRKTSWQVKSLEYGPKKLFKQRTLAKISRRKKSSGEKQSKQQQQQHYKPKHQQLRASTIQKEQQSCYEKKNQKCVQRDGKSDDDDKKRSV